MVLDTKKESLCINKIVGRKDVVVDVEGDIIIPDIKPDILSAVNTSGNVCIYKKDILDGKIKLEGSINIYVMYVPDGGDEGIRGLNTSLDFTQIIEMDNIRSQMSSQEDISLKLIECRVLNGRKINIRVSMQIKTNVYTKEDISLIQEIENCNDIQTLSNIVKINSLLGEGTSNVYAKDNLRIDDGDSLAEILKANFCISNKEIKVSYNKVLAKADLDAKIMYLTEDNRINTVKGKIPVMGFIDIPNVTDENIFDIGYKIKNIIIKTNSQDDNKEIYVESQIELSCCAYETKEVNIIQDLYSPKEDITFTQKKLNTMMGKQIQKGTCNINEQINIPELGNNRIYDVDIQANITNQNIMKNKITYEGEVILKVLYEANNTAKIDYKQMNIAFNYEMPLSIENINNNVETNIEIKNSNFVPNANGNVDCNIELEIEANASSAREINIMDEINSEEMSPVADYSMVIYFVKKGDNMWSIAKKFKSTIDDITKMNQIDDDNSLKAGMQLFIPKYNCKKVV